jgi:serine/threonine protein phosphatase PrpC
VSARIEVTGYSHPGRVRAHNDDSFCIGPLVEQIGGASLAFETSSRFFNDFGLLCAVADGMGGYEGGALASKTVLETLSALFYAQKHSGMDAAGMKVQLETDFSKVLKVLEATLHREGLNSAGTTLAGVVLLPGNLSMVFHCGDSRVLRFSGRYVRALTTDHTPLAAEIAAGRLDEAGAAGSPLTSKVSRALGLEGDTRVEMNVELGWDQGDSFLLCTDGFHGLGRGLSTAMLRDYLTNISETKVCSSLASQVKTAVEKSVELDGHDNATLVQIQVLHDS